LDTGFRAVFHLFSGKILGRPVENRGPVETVEKPGGFPQRDVEAQTLEITGVSGVFHSFPGHYGDYCFLKI